MTPEIFLHSVAMPFEGDNILQDYAQQMIDEYKQAGISPYKAWAQSFNLESAVGRVEACVCGGVDPGVATQNSGVFPTSYPACPPYLCPYKHIEH